MGSMTQGHIFYSGTVQGVGFRYTVERYARNLDLKGWVRNLPDGRVEIVTEGPKEKVEQLCRHVEEYFREYIEDKKADFAPAESQFKDFRIIM